jgi:hypothetical protein
MWRPTEAATIETQLVQVRRKISRLVDALAAGPDDLPSVRASLAGLERERAGLEDRLTWTRLTVRPAGHGDLQATAERMLEALHPLRALLDEGTVEERRAVVRCFLEGIRIEKATRQATLRWFRLPRSLKLVELRGIEPLTPRLPASCSPS